MRRKAFEATLRSANDRAVEVIEVGTRDGLQIEKKIIPTAVKIELVNRMIDAGLRTIEVTSFVSPKAVPQLADAEDVLAGIARRPDTTLTALVPNLRAAQRACKTSVDAAVLLCSGSNTHNQKNLNRTIDETIAGFTAVADCLGEHDIGLIGAIATTFGCPFEGDIALSDVLRIAAAYVKAGAQCITLSDTTGMATPKSIRSVVRAARSEFPDMVFALHLHNTRGIGLANVMVGLDEGIRRFDSSAGGLGGCPFAAGATGNICTEDLLYLLEESGYATGVDLEKAIDVALHMETLIGRPLSTMMLADMGADVVKVEGPGDGDPIRNIGAMAEGLSWYFAAFNRNKRSIIVDLRSEQGRATLSALLARADVLVENFRPGVLAKIGFDEATLERINPRLIVASVNGYGSTGPYAQRPAFDFVVQAMSGFMSLNGERDGMALRSGPPLTDLIAGLYAAFGIVNALRLRDKTGVGQRVEASMMASIMSMFAYYAADHLATGALPARTGNDHPIASPYGLFAACDGDIAVAPSTEAVLEKFMMSIGLHHLLAQPRFATNALRVVNRTELNVLIDERLRSNTQAYWVEKLNAAGVPCGIVQNIAQALSDSQTVQQEMVIEVDHPGHGVVKMLGFPVKLSATPCQVRYPAPEYGADTEAVLREWL